MKIPDHHEKHENSNIRMKDHPVAISETKGNSPVTSVVDQVSPWMLAGELFAEKDVGYGRGFLD